MRILFVNGTSTGGSAKSTDELACRLQERGHDVVGLFGWRRRPPASQLDQQYRPVVWRRRAARRWDRSVRWARAHLPPPPFVLLDSAYPKGRDLAPERSLGGTCRAWSPEVVVVTTVGRSEWRTMHSYLAGTGIPSVLYVRGEVAIERLADGLPDLVVVNARAFVDRARSLGAQPVAIPSVVETTRSQVAGTRERVLFVNPIRRHGLATVLAIARLRPDIPFTVHESTPLSRRDVTALQAAIASNANVELRRAVADPRQLYRDTRLLLVPYEMSNRPRIVLEAHANGLPVVARDLPALRECVGPGGLVVAPDASPSAWAGAVGELWDDPARYAACSEAALDYSRRDEVDPALIAERFEAELVRLLASRQGSVSRSGR